MAVTIIIGAGILVWTGINLRKMAKNVKAGRSIDGCDGNCSHCSCGCGH